MQCPRQDREYTYLSLRERYRFRVSLYQRLVATCSTFSIPARTRSSSRARGHKNYSVFFMPSAGIEPTITP